jgi:outer membrane immunogenic protein
LQRICPERHRQLRRSISCQLDRFYVGIHAGYSWGRWDGDLTFNPGTGPIVVFDPSHRTINAHGWLAGGQIGFNYQLNTLVFGLEADASWTNLKGNGSFNTIPSFASA